MAVTPPPGSYHHLVDRLNRSPQGAPPSDALFKILSVLLSEREAGLVAQLPIKPFTAEKAARIWGVSLAEAIGVLDGLASRAVLLDLDHNGQTTYVLPPPMAGFFEFSMMRARDDVDQHLLAELYYHYCTVEDDFMKALIAQGDTQLGRVFVNEPILQPEVHVLDYERASEVIKTASHRGISRCYCRYKMEEAGRETGTPQACDAPQDICMTFNGPARSLIKAGFAREVDPVEGLDLLQLAQEHNLVQFGENVREEVSFICNCCGCCCEAMIAARRFALTRPIHTTNYEPVVATDACTGCGQCTSICPVEAMTLVSAHDPGQSTEAEGLGQSGRLPGLRRLRPRLPDGEYSAGAEARTCRDALQHGPAYGHDGHRTRHAPGPDLRQSRALEPPGDGHAAGRHPEAAADQTGDGDRAGQIALP